MSLNGMSVNLQSFVTPFHNKIGIYLYCEVSVINLENLKVVQTDLNLGRRFARGVERGVELAVVAGDAEHPLYGTKPSFWSRGQRGRDICQGVLGSGVARE